MLAKFARTTGELLITAGLIVLFFVAYEVWGTGVQTANAQHAAAGRLEAAWAAGTDLPGGSPGDDPVVASAQPGASRPPPAPPTEGRPPAPAKDIPLGTGLARLHIPRFGSSYKWVVVEGVSRENLKDGPGHYPGTALPGQVGNFVVSGHRTTYGAPFGGVAELQPGDAIVVETAKTWFTYRVRSHEIVDPTDVAVTFAVPGSQDAVPTERLMTFTTCHPKYSAKQRYILYSVLENALPKASGALPPALQAS